MPSTSSASTISKKTQFQPNKKAGSVPMKLQKNFRWTDRYQRTNIDAVFNNPNLVKNDENTVINN